MVAQLIWIYLCGLTTTTCGALIAARSMLDRPPTPSMKTIAVVSVMAGALWPVLVVGIAQAVSLAAIAKLVNA